ncbi:hypothetical protein DPEC_G00070860 [Dallia pectoralis]|uniref:Uncharacterized protein n=1 Tax=Dallia pectoralis TaxID=75939 RepID=A0ACC2H2U8_DALPE|nr:hypothetical protein DPEC_G00070860 [Dallia pectoralis]
MKTITGFKQKKQEVEGGRERANELNQFFNRFDTKAPIQPPVNTSSSPHPPASHPADYPTNRSAPTSPKILHSSRSSPNTTTTGPLLHHPHRENITGDSPLPSTRTSLFIKTTQVKRELLRLRPGKAPGPDGVSPRVLKGCTGQLAGVLQHIFNLSVETGRVPAIWKTSCIVPVPKNSGPSILNDFRPVALTSHCMKVLERLMLQHLRPLVRDHIDPLQFAYQPRLGVEDAIIFMLHRAYHHLEGAGSMVRIMFFDFSSAFNTIRPILLARKLSVMQMDLDIVAWITDYLTDRPQFVRLQSSLSDVADSNTGSPQGTVLSPCLFTLYTSDFRYNSGTCHLQKFADDSSIVGCITEDNYEEYSGLVQSFVRW